MKVIKLNKSSMTTRDKSFEEFFKTLTVINHHSVVE